MITLPEEAEKFQKQAAKDWETILLARAKELAPGKDTMYLAFICFVKHVHTNVTPVITSTVPI